ncbi:SxtJ family membrane protein [Candidatus Njordibacter sp. Uisw_039]|uniref:SxtJ family membrane protein n=1 Tax=Candidatus Njordibacter sp. Uisw_039 TaxID=3230972 RepID=UPI003D4E2FA4
MKPLPSDRSFGFFVSTIMACASVYFLIKHPGAAVQYVFIFSSILVLFIALVFPQRLHSLNRVWFSIGEILGKIVSPIVLSVIYFGLITPIALSTRLSGRDELRLKKRVTSTYWVERGPGEPSPDSFNNQF